MKNPEVSVVIVSSRRTRLAFALEALADQSFDPGKLEVVVVRDNPRSSPPHIPGLEPIWIDSVATGNIATLRNLGWRAASGEYVAFTDDDCRPEALWLERLMEHSDADRLVQGRTVPDPDEVHLLHGLARSQRVDPPSGWFETSNLLYPRELIEGLGGFDERFAALGEDADLGLRAIEAGARVVPAKDATVRHAVLARTLPGAVRRALRRDTMALLVSRHPHQRELMTLRLFWNDSHWRLLLAATGVVAARHSRPWALAALLPYLKYHFDPKQRTVRAFARQLASLAPRAIVDSAEVAATARGAARERSLVL